MTTAGMTTAAGLTSLAAVKRACALEGAALELVDSTLPHLALTKLQGPRPIVRVQTNAVSIRGCHRNGGETYDPDVESWIYWPKASEIRCDGDTFTLDYGRGTTTYRVVVPS